jgi:hypothetical protein
MKKSSHFRPKFSIASLVLSRPLLVLRLGEYWFRISRYVYDRNRPLAPILRQRRCSLMYDVYWRIDDDDTSCTMVQKDQNTWNTIQDQNWIFFFWTTNNEQWKAKESNGKQKSNKRQMKVKQQQNKLNNNNKNLLDINGTWVLCTT